MLEQRHGAAFAVYNLSARKMKHNFDGRLSEVSLGTALRPPGLNCLFLIARNCCLWLRQAPANLAVLVGPETYLVTVAAAVLVYARLVDSSQQALELIAARRSRPNLCPSFLRYLDYVVALTQPEGTRPHTHNRPLNILALRVSPLPLFNRAKTGCRPFLELHVNGERALTTSQEYDKLPGFETTSGDTRLDLKIGMSVVGDVCLALFHARSTLGSKVQGRFAGLPILRLAFHTALLQPGTKSLDFPLAQLDELDEDGSKYGEGFKVTLLVEVGEKERPLDELPAYASHDAKGLGPKLLTSDQEERELISRSLGIRAATRHSPETQVRESGSSLVYLSMPPFAEEGGTSFGWP